MLDSARLVLLLGYLSLAYELLFLHVPSVASATSRLGGSSPMPRPVGVGALLLAGSTVLAIGAVLAPLFVGLTQPPMPFPIWLPGAVLLVFGRALCLRATCLMRRVRATNSESSRVQDKGLFRMCRNPGLLGMFLFLIGATLMTPSFFSAAAFLYYLIHMHQRVLVEETYLAGAFGDGWNDYVACTPRYLPFPGTK